ncbi:MAG: putative addiction module antidote protein [Alphaproteobacteria bacterium]|nr:putative addiction module antidote protein [Alphaproteobacteria bacterium]
MTDRPLFNLLTPDAYRAKGHTKTEVWDAAEFLSDDETIAAYLEDAFEEASRDGDTSIITKAIGDVMRACNISEIGRATGLSRDTLYNAFGPDGNPRLATLLAVTKALGFTLTVKPAHAEP